MDHNNYIDPTFFLKLSFIKEINTSIISNKIHKVHHEIYYLNDVINFNIILKFWSKLKDLLTKIETKGAHIWI